MSTSYTWRLHDAAGRTLTRTVSFFPTQADAEGWLGEEWAQLADDGIDAVTLVHGEDVVYGPMSLQGEQ